MWQSSLVTLVSPSLSSISKLKLKPTSSAPNLADYDLQVTATIIQQDEAETPPREDTCCAEMHPVPKSEELETPGAES